MYNFSGREEIEKGGVLEIQIILITLHIPLVITFFFFA